MVTIRHTQIVYITARRIRVDSNQILVSKDTMAMSRTMQELNHVGSEFIALKTSGKQIPEVQIENKIRDFDLRQNVTTRHRLLEGLNSFQCIHCTDFEKHVRPYLYIFRCSLTLTSLLPFTKSIS